MINYQNWLNYLDTQFDSMCDLLVRWANVNTGTSNLPGLARMLDLMEHEFAILDGEAHKSELQPQVVPDETGALITRELGKALMIRKRPHARMRVLLCCHMDTVYPADHAFQRCVRQSEDKVAGPGVTDAKGGILVMLKALEAFERCPFSENLGWQVLINPDEEIGSPGSRSLLDAAADENDLGLVFEPSFADGNLVGPRKGSGNFTVIVTGRPAHAGREPHLGRNAINAMAEFIVRLNSFPFLNKGTTINVGHVHGGGPVNVVPAKALVRFNVRVPEPRDQALVEEHIRATAGAISDIDGISLEIYGGFTRPPKPLDGKSVKLLQHIAACGRDMGLNLKWSPSGGACDGNNLASRGLCTVDSLGVTGGCIHSPDEFVLLRSIPERAKLAALFLMKLASGEIDWPPESE
jgi:glutamate carboxypeptidase